MGHEELWLTALLNHYLASVPNGILSLFHMRAADPAHPWSNFMAMQVLVALIIVAVFAMLRPRLSMDRPGRMQHVFEIIYNFLQGQTDEVVGRHGHKYMAFFGTIFIFILFANLIGAIPSFEAPTMYAEVPLGCALATFFYYNYVGFRAQGVFSYLKHFTGPMPILAPLMIPIEIISNLARPLSLTIRLYANMYAGEQVILAFFGLVPLIIPLPFMGLHVFVAFLQAYIFVLLTMVYVGSAVAHEH